METEYSPCVDVESMQTLDYQERETASDNADVIL